MLSTRAAIELFFMVYLEYSFDIFVLGNPTGFILIDLAYGLLQSLVRTPYSLDRVGFG